MQQWMKSAHSAKNISPTTKCQSLSSFARRSPNRQSAKCYAGSWSKKRSPSKKQDKNVLPPATKTRATRPRQKQKLKQRTNDAPCTLPNHIRGHLASSSNMVLTHICLTQPP